MMPCVVFTLSKMFSYLNQPAKNSKAKANGLITELEKKRKVDDITNTET